MGFKQGTHETFEVSNVAMATKDTEYDYVIPNGTERITIKLRDPASVLRLYSETGGSDYITVPQSSSYTIDGVKLSGKTLYLQSDNDTQVAEIIAYQ
ncbi:MAG: hypothetical protein KKD44_27720 [Proteobacteria bacterium]|nr:hypothetical protein [Pseudomonadota bacterium]